MLQPVAFWRNASRPVQAVCAAVPILLIVWYLLIGTLHEQPKGALHLLIPATSSNTDLCKLLLSAQILHYPVAALINWKAPEAKDAYVQHLAKVSTILNYLHILEKTASQDDLILILDGYDIWLQLRPEVLLKRYFKVIEATDARSQELYGKPARHTILFGPDKICWPIDFTRPACWAVPHLPLDEGAWGPPSNTDEHNMPRWLNSGTIMGPLGDMRDYFQATLELIEENHVTDSDQFYFANVWGKQEYARISSDASRLQSQKNTVDRMERWQDPEQEPERSPADLAPGKRTDYFVTLDYLSELFQTLAFYKQFLTFMRVDHSWIPNSEVDHPGAERYRFKLPEDVLDSPLPFADLERYNKTPKADVEKAKRKWEETELCINTVTDQVPVSLHFTGEKGLRWVWWEKIWFQSDAKLLREASLAVPELPLNNGKPINGRIWSSGAPPGAEKAALGGRAGAMSDREEYIPWEGLCGEEEFKELYRKEKVWSQ